MKQLIYQTILLGLAVFAMLSNQSWEPFMAASLLCAAMPDTKG